MYFYGMPIARIHRSPSEHTMRVANSISNSEVSMKLSIALLVVSLFFLSPQSYGFDSGWSMQSSHTFSNLYGVSFCDANTWVAVGDGGTIIRSTDGGIGWSPISNPVFDPLRAVSFRGNIGLAVGFSGRVLRSTDSGLSWIQETRPTTRNLYSVSVGSSVAVITGEEGMILISTDVGVSWSQRVAGTASVLFGVSVQGTTAVGVGGRGAVAMSANGGQGWGLTVLGDPQALFFYGTSFFSPTTGWAVGSYQPTGSIILKSTQSGFVWTLQSAPTTNILMGVSFASIDTGTAVGFSGTIVHTTNSGADWTSQQSNTLQSLNAVSFVDPRTGITVGDSGTILRTMSGGLTDAGQYGQSQKPLAFQLEQNFPNPFNPSTTIRYRIDKTGRVSLRVFNVIGGEVATITDETQAAGQHDVKFDATNLPSGLYFYRIQVGGLTEIRRMVLLK
jgi:photosystem II stability/assembly factor-like uncharacterized protein